MTTQDREQQLAPRNIDPFIFSTVALVVALLLLASFWQLETVGSSLQALRSWIVSSFSWLFVSAVTGFALFALCLAFSRYGGVVLGPDGSKPAFGTLTWFAMLFSAGMGIGLVFYGVAEPIMHFDAPPFAEPRSADAARDAMRISIFHWGIHAWGIYAVMGLALAYTHHRLQQPLSIRSTLSPLLGRYTHRWPGKIIDVVAVLATLFGLATSLGLGATQINAGLNFLWGVEMSSTMQLTIIAVITLCATVSLVTGLHRGIRRLSEVNLVLAVTLAVFVLLLGPTTFILAGLPDLLGSYVTTLVELSLFTAPFSSSSWLEGWTLFYWAWWISWAPFVGMFIARVSAGRTIGEFVMGVLLVPTLAGILWFGTLGGSALSIELTGIGGIVDAVNENMATAIYALLNHYPLASLTSTMAIILIAIFFITSSDSGSFVVDMLASGGNPSPPVWQRVFWATTEGAIAAVLLLVGGLSALQAGAVSTGLPFCIILVAVCVALLKHLKSDPGAG